MTLPRQPREPDTEDANMPETPSQAQPAYRQLAPWLLLAALLALTGAATAETFTEDFEDEEIDTTPDEDWYNYRQGDDIGHVNNSTMVIAHNRSVLWQAGTTDFVGNRWAEFELAAPAQLDVLEFWIRGDPPSGTDSRGSQQVVKIGGATPPRKMVEFFLFCRDEDNPDGCQFKVRWDYVDSTGQTLVNETVNQTEFKIRMEIDWIDGRYRLFVNGVDDGIFPFLEGPRNIDHIRFQQFRGDVPWGMSFDEFHVEGATNETTDQPGGDVATGLQNFAQDIRFDSPASQFFLGILFWITMMAAVIVPLIKLGKDDTLVPAATFFGVLAAGWLVQMGFWPRWIIIALIIFAAASVAMVVRRFALGIRDASSGSGLVLGSLGYFLIASTLLAAAGFGGDTVRLPTSPAEQTQENGEEVNETQTFKEAALECAFTAVPTGLIGLVAGAADCSRETQTTAWKRIADAAGNVYGWVQASVNFIFQLLTFRFPIPTIFNVILVGPPAMALASYAIEVIRGSS